MDYILPSSSVHGILQARILEWVACPCSGDLPNPGIEPRSPALQGSLPAEPRGKPIKRSKKDLARVGTEAHTHTCQSYSGLTLCFANEK